MTALQTHVLPIGQFSNPRCRICGLSVIRCTTVACYPLDPEQLILPITPGEIDQTIDGTIEAPSLRAVASGPSYPDSVGLPI